MTINDDVINIIFKYMPPHKQEELISKLKAINLATNINKDPDFLLEAVEELSKEYPFIKEYIETQEKSRKQT